MTTSELALLCDVEPRVVHEWAARDRIRHFRTPGQHLRFHARDVAKFLETYERASSADLARRSVVALSKAEQRLRRRLPRGHTVCHGDPYAALIAAGGERARFFVVDRKALGKLDASAFIEAVTSELPETQLIWIGAVPKGKEAQVVPTDFENLRSVFT